jgi:hypothetical protein
MKLFQVGIKETESSAKVTSYHKMPELEKVEKELQELKENGKIYFFEVKV